MEMPNVKIELRFVPELLITLDDKTLGRVTFKDAKTMGKFIKGLHSSIKRLIKKFEAEERVAEGEKKLNEKRTQKAKAKAKKFFVPEGVVETFMSEFIDDFEQVKKYLNKVYYIGIKKVVKISNVKLGRDVFFQ